jgi:secondary thiamine-phosphate synthase enzyme
MISLSIKTSGQTGFVDITREVEKAVADSRVREGLALVFVPHTTAGITINEGADPSVQADIIRTLEQLIPLKGPYHHREGNSAAHIKTSLIGPSVSVIIENGRLVLGTWQAIFLCEFDGPRTRKVLIKIIP